MRTTSPARAVRKPALVIAAIAAIIGAIACSDVAPPTSPTTQVGVPNSAAASGYALASGKADTTKKK